MIIHKVVFLLTSIISVCKILLKEMTSIFLTLIYRLFLTGTLAVSLKLPFNRWQLPLAGSCFCKQIFILLL